MKKIISKKLYIDGLLRLKFFGIAALASVCLLGGFFALAEVYDCYISASYIVATHKMFFSPLAVIMVLSPMAIMLQFSFLNNRNSSDFFHSLPYKRLTVSISYYASALTWIAVIIVAPLIIMTAIYFLSPHVSFSLDVPTVCLIACLVSAFVLMSIMLIVVSVTGTVPSTVFAFLVMTLSVRTLAVLFKYFVSSYIDIIMIDTVSSSFFDPDFVIPLQFFQSAKPTSIVDDGFKSYYFEYLSIDSFGTTASILYALVLGAVCFFIGIFVFTRRASENAEKATSHPIVQHCLRCLVSLPSAIIAAMALYLKATTSYLLIFALSLTISVAVYFLYEIITARGNKKLIKTIPFFGVVILGALSFATAFKITENAVYSFNPQVEEIKCIYFSLNIESDSGNSYVNLLASKVELSDSNSIEIACETLNDYLSNIDASNSPRQPNYMSSSYVYSPDVTWRKVTFVTQKGKAVYRRLPFTVENAEALTNTIISSDGYAEIQFSIPDNDEISNITLTDKMELFDDLTNADTNAIWQSFAEEYKALSSDEKNAYETSFESQRIDKVSLIVSGSVDGNYFHVSYPITLEYTPKTFNLLLVADGQVGISSAKIKDISDALSGSTFDKSNIYISIEVNEKMYGNRLFHTWYHYVKGEADDKKDYEKITSMLSLLYDSMETPLNKDDVIVRLDMYYADGIVFEEDICFSLNKETYEKLLEKFGEDDTHIYYSPSEDSTVNVTSGW